MVGLRQVKAGGKAFGIVNKSCRRLGGIAPHVKRILISLGVLSSPASSEAMNDVSLQDRLAYVKQKRSAIHQMHAPQGSARSIPINQGPMAPPANNDLIAEFLAFMRDEDREDAEFHAEDYKQANGRNDPRFTDHFIFR